MTELAIYTLIALMIVIVAAVLARQTRGTIPTELESDEDLDQSTWDGPSLSLAERIFDPSDYEWLRDELGFPQAAELLAAHRRQMALKWLRALRTSFKELVRNPELGGAEDEKGAACQGWQLLWMTLRFQFLLSYALFVVRLFGPYHRLAPSLRWARVFGEAGSPGKRLAIAGRGRIS